MELKLLDINLVAFTFEEDVDHTWALRVSVREAEFRDGLPNSTWNKLLCYDHSISRPTNSSMMSATAECSIGALGESRISSKLNLLPIRLNIDQGALEFLIKYITDSVTPGAEPEQTICFGTPFSSSYENLHRNQLLVEKFELSEVKITIDYKPHKIEYSAIPQGNGFELLNLLPLEGSSFTLERIQLKNVSAVVVLDLYSSLFSLCSISSAILYLFSDLCSSLELKNCKRNS